MTTLHEGKHRGEFVLSEGNGSISRKIITLAILAAALPAGQVLGQITKDGTATSAAFAGNTGNGAMGTVTVGADAKPGVYKVLITEPGTNVGNFIVEDPDGNIIGQGDVDAAFSAGGLSFTLADGATDFAPGDGFDITVASGSGQYKAYDPDATDGSDKAVAILYGNAPVSAAAQEAVAIVRLAEVAESALTDIDAEAKANLAAFDIIVR